MEKVIDDYIRTNGLLRNPLHPCQHAYSAGRSTEIALYQLTHVVRDTIEAKESALCALLNIERAFDNMSHTEIQDAPIRMGVENTLALYMAIMLENKQIKVPRSTNSVVIKVVHKVEYYHH